MKTFLYKSGDAESHKKLGQELQKIPHGETHVITWKKNRPIRSLSANKYYHAILNMIATETGYSHEKMHDMCKLQFNPETVFLPGDRSIVVGKSTNDLDTKEFASYINRVKLWATETFGIVFPEPKDIDHQRWYDIEDKYERSRSGF